MRCWNLFQAEWQKTLYRPANWGILGSALCLVMAGLTLVTLSGFKGATQLARAATMLPFPNNLRMVAIALSPVVGILAVIFVANSVGSEYVRDTWKMVVPRNHRRTALLGMKLLTGVVGVFIMLTAAIVLGGLGGSVGALLLKLGPLGEFKSAFLKAQAGAVAGMSLEMVCYGMLALLATVATRSTIGGTMVGILTIPVTTVAVFNSQLAAKVLPTLYLTNITAQLTGNTDMVKACEASFGQAVSIPASLTVVACYTVFFAVSALILFQRRDLAE